MTRCRDIPNHSTKAESVYHGTEKMDYGSPSLDYGSVAVDYGSAEMLLQYMPSFISWSENLSSVFAALVAATWEVGRKHHFPLASTN